MSSSTVDMVCDTYYDNLRGPLNLHIGHVSKIDKIKQGQMFSKDENNLNN